MTRSSRSARQFPFVSAVLTATLAGSLLLVSGCTGSLLKMPAAMSLSKFPKLPLIGKDDDETAFEDDEDYFATRVETPLLSDYISVKGNTLVPLRGVGLVTGLDGTGDDPPPSYQRNQLREEMTRRGIPNPNEVLRSRNTALVLVIAYLPAMVRSGQTFDVRVMLPPNSEATSLEGGHLLETRLTEEQIAGNRLRKGHEYAVASGAIVTALGASGADDSKSALLRRGNIPGGAVSKTARDLEVVLRNDVRSTRNATRISGAISERFHHYDRYGQRATLAEPKTDALIALKMHPNYRNNFPRYQQVIRSIAFRETDVARRMRLELLADEVLEPETAATAALQLEAIGRETIPFLKPALESDSPEVRFYAAMSLAYQEDSSGVDILKQAAMDEPAFRVYALAALSVITDARAVVALRELLDSDTLETRYGALRALKENDPNDPALGTTTYPGQFIVHAIQSDGPAMVHVTRYRSPEVTIFGTEQALRLPLYLNAGNRISIMGKAGDQQLTISKYEIGQDPVRQAASTRLTDVIRVLGDLGATYPDIVRMLVEADLQHNLAGEFGVDQLPQAGRAMVRYGKKGEGSGAASSGSGRRVGSPALIPDLFDRVEDDDARTREQTTSPPDPMFDTPLPAHPAADSEPPAGDDDPKPSSDEPPSRKFADLSEPSPGHDTPRRADNTADDDQLEAEQADADSEYIPQVEEAEFTPSLWQRMTAPFRN